MVLYTLAMLGLYMSFTHMGCHCCLGNIHDYQLELGIETVEGFRGKGFAQHTCSTLIDNQDRLRTSLVLPVMKYRFI